MYRKHFGLIAHPFSKEIETENLYASAAMCEMRARISHLIDLRGMGLVTGEAGSGKSTTCRKVVSELHTGLNRVVYIPNSSGNVMDLYKSIAWEFGLPTERSRAALYKQIRGEVTRLCQEARQKPILIVDEAHFLRSDVLEDLRMLTNYAMDSENRLCLVLVAQPELRRRITMAAHEALNQRIVVRAHMKGLGRDELDAYFKHLLKAAGTELQLFEPAAQEAIFQATSGLPRKVNLLAHHALIAAALASAKTVTAEHVESALAEVK